jgi:hypothetical protein
VYDDFDDDGRNATRHLPPVWVIAVLTLGVVIAVMVGAMALINHNRVARSNRLAVKYGLATSTKDVSPAARCTAQFRNDYDTTSSSLKAGLPPGALAVLAPKACALGVQQGVVRQDGTVTEENANKLTVAAIERMGPSRFQTLVFNELAVTPYHLAKQGHVTRWHRCVAMGYSGYDAQSAEMNRALPPRAQFFPAVREACTNGIARGLVPPSGAPSQRDTALLLREALAE